MYNSFFGTKFKYIFYVIIIIAIFFLFISIIYKNEESTSEASIEVTNNFFDSVNKLSIEGVDNILLYENSDNEIISINIKFKAGSVFDPKGLEGLAYFMSSAMSQSAGGYSIAEFNRMLEEYSISLNVATERDVITFSITTLSYYKERAFNLLRLILNSPNFSLEDIDITKKNMIADYNIYSNKPKYLAYKELNRQLFGNHIYFRDIQGNPKTISKFTKDMLSNFHKKVITKKNIYIAISGNINQRDVTKELEKILNQLPEGDEGFLKINKVHPRFSNKVIEVQSLGASQSEVFIVLPSHSLGSYVYPYSLVLNTYLGRMPDSLLFDKVRNQNGLVYTITSSLYEDSITNYWLISLGTSIEKADEAILLVKKTILDMKQGNYNFDDIIVAKNWMLDNDLRAFSSNNSMASYLNNIQFFDRTFDYVIETRNYFNSIKRNDIDQLFLDVHSKDMLSIKIVNKK